MQLILIIKIIIALSKQKPPSVVNTDIVEGFNRNSLPNKITIDTNAYTDGRYRSNNWGGTCKTKIIKKWSTNL